MRTNIPQETLDFLRELAQNNHKDWMDQHRKRYKASEHELKQFYDSVEHGLQRTDELSKRKISRINRDIRFSKDKTPYNVHRSVSFSRAGAERRGGYYLRIEPGNKSRVAGGFFGPNKEDLFRIRKEFEMDASEIRSILNAPAFKKTFGGAFSAWDPVKTAPKGFSKEDPNIDLIRLKNFVVSHTFTDEEITHPNFSELVVAHFELLRPFFDYMSEVLTTNLNGESILQ